MIVGVSFIICSLIYILLLCCAFFSKKRIKTLETDIYTVLLVLNIIGLILELMCCFTVVHMNEIPVINILCNRMYLIYFATFITLFTVYMYVTCNKNNIAIKGEKNAFNKNEKVIIVVSYIIIICCVLFLPLNYYYDSNAVYSYGPAADSLIITSLIYIIIDFMCVFKNLKKLNKKKLIPMGALMILFIMAFIIRNINPGIILITCSFTFVTAIMYFTIENPDVKVIEQLRMNKKLIEQGNEDKSNFLFRISQEVKKPIDDILKVNDILNNTDDIETIKKGIKYIDYNSKELKFLVNNVLDVTKMDSYNIKIIDSTYNVYNIFTEIFTKYENIIDKKIEFRHNISKNLPQVLYGDSVKLKQVVTTILENACEYTIKGFIEVNVDSIIKNDICRLIISISDSGCGMSLDKVNELLSISNDLTEEDITKLDNINLDFNIASKIIKLCGGQVIIKSEEGIGSEFIITVDQKIKNEELDNKFNDYTTILSNKKKILIVDDKKEELDYLVNYLKDYNVDIATSMYGIDCLDRLNNKQKFDLILLKDEMKILTGINTFQKLKDIDNFKIPVVIILDKSKESIKHHYIEEGFSDYLLKEDIDNEIKRIISKYL